MGRFLGGLQLKKNTETARSCAHRGTSRRLAWIVAATLLSPIALAQDGSARAYDIPAQTLATALKEFAAAADLQLMFSPEVVAGRMAQPVRGEYTIQQVLNLLLDDTGLEFRFDGHNTVIVRPPDTASAPRMQATRLANYQAEGAAEPASSGGAQASTAETAGVLQEIIVTAQKRAERIQDVPMSITAFGERELERKGVASFQDYARMVPGLAFVDPGPGRQDFIIRGITSAGNPITQFYIDDTPQSASNAGGTQIKGADPRIFDIERVEVLRGPQGTLYGASSMGGTIRVITNKPDPSAYLAKAETTLATIHDGGENFGVNGMLNLPLIEDQLAIRVVGMFREEAGWIDRVDDPVDESGSSLPRPRGGEFTAANRDQNTNEVHGARFSARYEPTSDLTLTAAVFWQDIEQKNPNLVDVARKDKLQRAGSFQEPRVDETTQTSLTIEYDFGRAELISSTSYLDRFVADRTDATSIGRAVFGTNFAIPNERSNPFTVLTQEVRIASPGDSRFDYTVGLFYLKLDGGEDQTLYAPGFSAATGIPIAGDLMFDENTTSTEEQFAVFGQASYDITERLQVTTGFRWFTADTDFISHKEGRFNGGATLTTGKSSDQGWTPKISFDYHLDDERMVYASAAKGFRVGAPNTFVPPGACGADLQQLGFSSAPTSIESDSLWQYELGTKTGWLHRRLIVNAAVYYIDWSGIPQSRPLDCGFPLTLNVGQASSRGVELEIQTSPADGWSLGFAGSYTDAQLEKDSPSLSGQRGDRLQNVPRLTLAANAQYTFPVMNGYNGFIAGDINYAGESYINFNFANPTGRRPSYDIANLRFGVEAGDWEAALFIENVLDERAVLSIDQSNVNTWTINRPRTIGITLRKSWQ
jgi:iron complex outermembrane recepter protein